jgi:hypothetical protein
MNTMFSRPFSYYAERLLQLIKNDDTKRGHKSTNLLHSISFSSYNDVDDYIEKEVIFKRPNSNSIRAFQTEYLAAHPIYGVTPETYYQKCMDIVELASSFILLSTLIEKFSEYQKTSANYQTATTGTVDEVVQMFITTSKSKRPVVYWLDNLINKQPNFNKVFANDTFDEKKVIWCMMNANLYDGWYDTLKEIFLLRGVPDITYTKYLLLMFLSSSSSSEEELSNLFELPESLLYDMAEPFLIKKHLIEAS